MAQEWQVEGKNFLITGGASGLGAAYVEAFLKLGAENVAILDINEKRGKEFAAKLSETYESKAIFIKCDVSNEEEIKNSFEQVLTAFKRIDVIINNAGVMDDSIDVWRLSCDINWQGLVSFTRKGIEHMRKDKDGSGGTIINISSTAALTRVDILPTYCGSKAAVLHFSRSLSSQEFYDNTGVRILTLCLGPTATPLLDNIEPKTIDQKFSKSFLAYTTAYPYSNQSIESAVTAFVKMFREGNPGSVWLAARDRTGQDITSVLDEAENVVKNIVFPSDVPAYAK
ncbi:15-hydroxyprostaglandin dehydrogenase [NAD(+)]-like [Bicyclus anynana]|uniref:15-hydroxyprostaglandin dehydrogenase [NAD(+)]-like n=1 Tax=Bicyclus anynana TaxID=110368 RepID=A0A6J1MST7_BICAN|nr:15-hydroxyprostaglandin dehydrogenase [NAD(+)]-like [Bicyclus anynana]